MIRPRLSGSIVASLLATFLLLPGLAWSMSPPRPAGPTYRLVIQTSGLPAGVTAGNGAKYQNNLEVTNANDEPLNLYDRNGHLIYVVTKGGTYSRGVLPRVRAYSTATLKEVTSERLKIETNSAVDGPFVQSETRDYKISIVPWTDSTVGHTTDVRLLPGYDDGFKFYAKRLLNSGTDFITGNDTVCGDRTACVVNPKHLDPHFSLPWPDYKDRWGSSQVIFFGDVTQTSDRDYYMTSNVDGLHWLHDSQWKSEVDFSEYGNVAVAVATDTHQNVYALVLRAEINFGTFPTDAFVLKIKDGQIIDWLRIPHKDDMASFAVNEDGSAFYIATTNGDPEVYQLDRDGHETKFDVEDTNQVSGLIYRKGILYVQDQDSAFYPNGFNWVDAGDPEKDPNASIEYDGILGNQRFTIQTKWVADSLPKDDVAAIQGDIDTSGAGSQKRPVSLPKGDIAASQGDLDTSGASSQMNPVISLKSLRVAMPIIVAWLILIHLLSHWFRKAQKKWPSRIATAVLILSYVLSVFWLVTIFAGV